MTERTIWQCQNCETKLIEEDRGTYKKKYESYGKDDYYKDREYMERAEKCSHPRRVAPDGSKFCSRCGRGPLKEPYEVNSEILGSCCKDMVPIIGEAIVA